MYEEIYSFMSRLSKSRHITSVKYLCMSIFCLWVFKGKYNYRSSDVKMYKNTSIRCGRIIGYI